MTIYVVLEDIDGTAVVNSAWITAEDAAARCAAIEDERREEGCVAYWNEVELETKNVR